MENALYSALGIIGAAAVTGTVLLAIKDPAAFMRLYIASIAILLIGACGYLSYAMGFADGISYGAEQTSKGLKQEEISTRVPALPFIIGMGILCFMSVLTWAPQALGIQKKSN